MVVTGAEDVVIAPAPAAFASPYLFVRQSRTLLNATSDSIPIRPASGSGLAVCGSVFRATRGGLGTGFCESDGGGAT
jgi:hypothetical protein